VSFGEKIVMEPTLDKAIERIFGIYDSPEEQPAKEEYDNTNVNDLIEQANNVFGEATEASQRGDWSEYGEKLSELEDILNRLKLLTGGASQNTDAENNITENNVNEDAVTEEQQVQ